MEQHKFGLTASQQDSDYCNRCGLKRSPSFKSQHARVLDNKQLASHEPDQCTSLETSPNLRRGEVYCC